MTSRGAAETQQLQERLELQLDRLVQQLAELEECRADLDETEYEETKTETLDQLKEFNDSLSKMMSGNMTLVDKLGSMQLAIQAAISAAFQTPSVIRAFIRKEPDQLRQRMAEIERDMRLNKIAQDQGSRQKLEIIRALKQLGETLSPSEAQLLESNALSRSSFEQVSEHESIGEQALAMAGSQVRSINPTQ